MLPAQPSPTETAELRALLLHLTARAERLERKLDDITHATQATGERTTALEGDFRELIAIMETYVGRAANESRNARRSSSSSPWIDRRSYRAPARVAAISLLACLGAIGAFLLLVPARSSTPYFAPPRDLVADSLREPVRRQAPKTVPAPETAPASAPASSVEAAVDPAPEPKPVVAPQVVAASQPVPAAKAVAPQAVAATGTGGRVDLLLEASEPTWISVTPVGGSKLIDRLLEPGEPAWVKLEGPARLRAGNAAGLIVTVGGKPVGPIGPRGKVREVDIYADGTFKLVARAAAATPEAP